VRSLLAFLILFSLITAAACGRRKAPAVKAARIGAAETGIASWYGHPYHGRRAANGEIYDMDQLTAAHRTLPFDTFVRVTNLDNGRQVVVRIQDRGPFVKGRIIDLSRAAARQLQMIGPGTARVRITVVHPPAREPDPLYGVQIGAFADRQRAERLRRDVRAFGEVELVPREANQTLWRVIVGRHRTLAEAEEHAGRLRAAGYEGFVVRLN
jgi:rare lipoprotein A